MNGETKERSDAELLVALAWCWQNETLWWTGDEMKAVIDRGRDYIHGNIPLSGARPMPRAALGVDPALQNAEYTAGYCTICNTPVYHRPGKPGEYDHECTMPDTPAPDEVAQLRAEDEFKTALVNELTEAHTQLLLEHGGLKNENTALTARVAELEAELVRARRLAGEGGV